jgi:hypothetical protein
VVLKRLCPSCGSGKLEGVREVDIGDPKIVCQNCGWIGQQSDLLVREIKSAVAGGDVYLETVRELSQDLLRELHGRIGEDVGRAVLSVGLFPIKEFAEGDEKVKAMVTRLIRAGVMGAWEGILKEMSAIEKGELDGKD